MAMTGTETLRAQQHERDVRLAKKRAAQALTRKRAATIDRDDLILRRLNDLKRHARDLGYPASVDDALDPLSESEFAVYTTVG